MSNIGPRIAEAAASLIGTPFRLHGRNPQNGLDCVGVVWASLKTAGLKPVIPQGYTLRNRSEDSFLTYAQDSGLREVDDPPKPGDILLVRTGPAQLHLLIARSKNSFIHAHAGLRRVVALPAPLPWSLLKQWRYEEPQKRTL